MRYVIAGILALAACPAVAAADSAPPPSEIVPIYASSNRPLVMLTIGDSAPLPVVFDTGTDENILAERYVKMLKLPVVGSSPMIDAATMKRTMQPLVGLVQPKISGVSVAPATAQMVDYDEPDAVGVFGPGSFSGSLVTLEFGLGRLRLVPMAPDRLPAAPATPHGDGLPSMRIKVAGVTIGAHLDSGSTGDVSLPKSMVGKVPLKAPAKVIGQAKSISGTQDILGAQLDGDVVIGPLKLHDPEIVFVGAGSSANLGYSIMRQLTIVLDPANKRSWVLDPSTGPGPLSAFTGQFGPRTIRVDGGKLIHQREGRPAFELKFLGADLFEMPTGDRIQFYRKEGRVTSLELITAEGQIAQAERTS